MALSNFPGGFASGISIRGVPLVQTHPGKVFWVGNATASIITGGPTSGSVGQRSASDGNKGTFNDPFNTIAYALTQCTAGRGDIIFVKPGHAETIADATTLTFSVAGVAIVGLGVGSLRPTLTFSTANTANIPLTAANMVITNFLFKANFLNIASVFTATSTNTPTDTVIDRCEFRDGSTSLNFVTIVTGNATANSLDGLVMTNCRISSLATTAATTAIKISSATDRAIIQDNFGNWAVLNDTAAMLAAGANNMTNFDFARNILQRPNTSSTSGSFISTSATAWTGHAYDNYMYQLDASAGIWIATLTGGAFGFTQNYSPISGAVDKSGATNPVAV